MEQHKTHIASVISHSPITHATYHIKEHHVFDANITVIYIVVLFLLLVASFSAGTRTTDGEDDKEDKKIKFYAGVLTGACIGLLGGIPGVVIGFLLIIAISGLNVEKHRKYKYGVMCGLVIGAIINFYAILPSLKNLARAHKTT
jgi:uncharacterized membrane protein YfcA